MIKNSITLFCAIIVGSLGTILYYKYQHPLVNTKTNLPITHFSTDTAPTTSLQGSITEMSGSVLWQSRTEDQPLPVTTIPELQQGEKIATQNDGKVTIQFGKTITITAEKNTTLNFIQTLPVDMVIAQNGGKATYENIGNTFPISVRTAGLVTNLMQGKMVVSFDKETPLVLIQVLQGTATTAWNDGETNTQVVTIAKGKQFAFNTDTEVGNLSQ